MPKRAEEPEEDRREVKEDLLDVTDSVYGLWVTQGGAMGNTVGADGGGGRQGDRGEGEQVGRLEQEELGVAGGEWLGSEQVAESNVRRCRTLELEQLEQGELGVAGGEGLVSVRLTESKGGCLWRSTAAMRCIWAMEMTSTSWRRWRRRRHGVEPKTAMVAAAEEACHGGVRGCSSCC